MTFLAVCLTWAIRLSHSTTPPCLLPSYAWSHSRNYLIMNFTNLGALDHPLFIHIHIDAQTHWPHPILPSSSSCWPFSWLIPAIFSLDHSSALFCLVPVSACFSSLPLAGFFWRCWVTRWNRGVYLGYDVKDSHLDWVGFCLVSVLNWNDVQQTKWNGSRLLLVTSDGINW